MNTDLVDIKSLLLDELEERFLAAGEKKYRAGQVFSWLHKGVKSFHDMTDLPLDLRDRLSGEYFVTVPKIVDKQASAKDATVKYLWGLGSDSIESVLMQYKHGNTICLSSQMGCRMGCAFCASAIGGLVRNLTASEMLDQVIFAQIDSGRSISNIVLMGIGEPLDNFDNVMRFIRLACHHKGLNIGARHLTLSTCGIIENIDRLSHSSVQLSLAVSLHAPDDDTRSQLMPVNRAVGVKALMEAAGRYSAATGRRVTYEYALIDGVNDSPQQARLLSKLLKGTGSHLNLIPLNKIPVRGFMPSSEKRQDAFCEILLSSKVSFTTRRRLGADIDAACGQLRRKNIV